VLGKKKGDHVGTWSRGVACSCLSGSYAARAILCRSSRSVAGGDFAHDDGSYDGYGLEKTSLGGDGEAGICKILITEISNSESEHKRGGSLGGCDAV
jgi:hypothetical protein